jgi:hypothetical protein
MDIGQTDARNPPGQKGNPQQQQADEGEYAEKNPLRNTGSFLV